VAAAALKAVEDPWTVGSSTGLESALKLPGNPFSAPEEDPLSDSAVEKALVTMDPSVLAECVAADEEEEEAEEFAQAEAELMAARDKLAALQSARMAKRMPPLPASDEEGGGATPGLMMCGGGGGGDATPMLASMEEGCATPKLHDARINAACSYAQLQLAQTAHKEATQRLEKAQEAYAWAASGLRATEEFVARR